MTLLQRIGRGALWTEQLNQLFSVQGSHFRRAIVPAVRNVVSVMPKIFQTQLESSVGLNPNELAHFLEINRLPERCEAHHFVFVAKIREADELRDRRIENA